MRFPGFAVASCAMLFARILTAGDAYVLQHENVLGTGLEVRVWAESEVAARKVEVAVLAEIDRLSGIVSTYDPKSEFRCWQAAGKPQKLSSDLISLLRACDHWRSRTGDAFHPGVERLSRVWRAAEATNVAPDDSVLAAEVAHLRGPLWSWSGDFVTPQRETPVTFNAIAKGMIVDSVCDVAGKVSGIQGVTINIGGDLRCRGEAREMVTIPSPRAEATGGSVLDVIVVQNRAVATSSGNFRGFDIAGKHYSHLIDPRSGKPVDHILSVTVVAPKAEEADALATACSVMDVAHSLELVNSLKDVECLIVDHEGNRHHSPGWIQLAQAAAPKTSEKKSEPAKEEKPWNGGYELKVDFEIQQPAGGGRYRRPYVAVWVEDPDGISVKTLALWIQSTGPGPRWLPDLKRWYRSDRIRKVVEGTDLVTTVSEATRKPGQYSVTWKGTDNDGKLISPGEYTVYLEVAREHGTYQIMRQKVTFGDKPFTEKLEGNIEIKAATLEYRKSPPAKAR